MKKGWRKGGMSGEGGRKGGNVWDGKVGVCGEGGEEGWECVGWEGGRQVRASCLDVLPKCEGVRGEE